MNDLEWDATFEEFITNIVLTATQAKKIDNSLYSISKLFLEKLELSDVDIYVQGSFATSTTVKPLTSSQSHGKAGEYDVDIVIQSANWDSARQALDVIDSILRSDERYSDKISSDKKSSCERVDYGVDASGVGYHVDIVPIKKEKGVCKKADRGSDTWQQSESKKLVNWVNQFADTNPNFRPTVLAMKRLRDVLGLTDLLPSTVMVVLIAYTYKTHTTYLGDFMSCLEYLRDIFNTDIEKLQIPNPVQSEDFADRYRDNRRDYQEISLKLNRAYEELLEAFGSGDLNGIQKHLSTDFPNLLPANVRSLRQEGYAIQTNGSFESASIDSSSQNGQQVSRLKRVFYELSKSIVFNGDAKFSNSTIKWQVCNATGSRQLRGDWFAARGLGGGPGTSLSPTQNHETEVYFGEHWTRYAAIKNRIVIAMSPKYRVEVKGQRPGYVSR